MLMRKFYGECGQITHNQIILPTQIIPELLKTLHGATAKHPGITKMIQECRAKYYHPGLAKHISRISRIPTHHHDERCILTLPLRIPNAKHDGTKNGKMHH